jgi:hypothetical protein
VMKARASDRRWPVAEDSMMRTVGVTHLPGAVPGQRNGRAARP